MSGSHSVSRWWGLLAATGLGTAGLGALGGWWGGWGGGAAGALAGLAGPAVVDYLVARSARGREVWAAWRRLGAEVAAQSWSRDDGYAALLRPERCVVRFIPRPELVDVLMDWARGSQRRLVLLLTGAGGVGKTRLALHGASLLAAGSGWLCRQVADGQEAAAVPVARQVAGKRRVLLIVDYAETRTGLAALLDAVAAQPAGDQRVRVLLLARSAGEWWRQLAATPAGRRLGAAVFGGDVFDGEPADGRTPSQGGPVEVTAQVREEQDDEAVVREAVPVFADRIGVAPPERMTIVLDTAGRPSVLELHAAALLLVLAAASGAEPRVVVSQVLNEVIRHEERYWQLAAQRAGLAVADLTVLRRAVAVACLIPVRDEDGAAAALGRVPDLRGPNEQRRRDTARWLHGLYPPDTLSWLGPLAPDLFAERHVCAQLAASTDFANACFEELDPAQARHALTVLARATRHAPAAALLTRALTRNLPALAEPAIAVAVQTGVVVGRLFAEVLRDAPPDAALLARILDAIPYPSTALAGAAATVANRVVALLPPESDPATTARALRSAGLRWTAVGQPDKALDPTQRAVTIYQQLARTEPDRYEPDLAQSLANLSESWAELEQPDEALKPIQQAVAIYERLAKTNPDRYEPDLVDALTGLGIRWWDLGQPEEALNPTQRAVAICEANPGRYEEDLAAGLTNLGPLWQALGQLDKALEATQRALPLHERLATTNPDRYESSLGAVLGSLGALWSQLGQPDKALEHTQRAMAIYERLSKSNPVFEKDLAAVLYNLGLRWWELERPREASDATGQAVAIYERLNETNPSLYDRNIAFAFASGGTFWSELGQPDIALEHTQRAVATYERLAQANPDRYEPDLAATLDDLGIRWAALGHHDEAIEATQRAVVIYERLAQANPDRHEPDLAATLTSLGVLRSAVDEVDAGLAELARALRIMQRRGLDDEAEETRQELRILRRAHPELADQAWRDHTHSEPPPWLTDP